MVLVWGEKFCNSLSGTTLPVRLINRENDWKFQKITSCFTFGSGLMDTWLPSSIDSWFEWSIIVPVNQQLLFFMWRKQTYKHSPESDGSSDRRSVACCHGNCVPRETGERIRRKRWFLRARTRWSVCFRGNIAGGGVRSRQDISHDSLLQLHPPGVSQELSVKAPLRNNQREISMWTLTVFTVHPSK